MLSECVVEVLSIERNVSRSGSVAAANRVLFKIETGIASSSSIAVWVSSDGNDGHLVSVARRILGAELARISKALRTHQDRTSSSSSVLRSRQRANVRQGRQHGSCEGRIDDGHQFRIRRYVLQGRDPVPCDDLEVWKAFMQSHARWVADTSLPAGEIGIVRICTVFAGLDMSLGVDVPVLFETIILGGSRDRELHRYTSWEDAEQGHAAIVQLVQGHINQRTAATLKSARDLARQTLTLARKFSSSKSADSTLAGIQ